METLYHYTSGQGMLGILQSEELHCSHVNFMNDPSESSYFNEVLQTVFKSSPKAKVIYDNLFNASYVTAIADPFDRYVASFSKNRDSLSMWNHYAKGNGYSLGLNLKSIVKDLRKSLTIQAVELQYDREEQINSLKEFLLRYKKDSLRFTEIGNALVNAKNQQEHDELTLEEMDLTSKFNENLHTISLTMKHPAYEREAEVRLIISENKVFQNTSKFKVSENGVFVEYLPIAIKIGKHLKCVTVHPLNSDLHLNGVRKFLFSKIKNKDVDIKSSLIPFRIV